MSGEEDLDLGLGSQIESRTDQRVKTPRLYRVILYNDDYTTMDFVVLVLKEIFNKPDQDAELVMMDVHKKGQGVCGVYIYDVAVTKVKQVHKLARENEFPLRCGYEIV